MKISNVVIENYRNLRNIDIELQDIVTIIGENNSGKSNFLKAITLPFLSDDISYNGKNLYWSDFNAQARKEYYDYILAHQDGIKGGEIGVAEFENILPKISVEVTLKPEDTELYDVKSLGCEMENGEISYKLKYEYTSRVQEIYDKIKKILLEKNYTEDSLEKIKMNLLPVELYTYSIFVPKRGDKVSFDILRRFKYSSLVAERDEFSFSNEKIGSKSLVKLLQMKLDEDSKLKVEEGYSNFFDTVKDFSKMEQVFNWQEVSDLKKAKDFFEKINILPNMPPMTSILNSVRLGYQGESLSLQGLGYRNLVLLMVLMNSLKSHNEEVSLDVLTLEEPEAHLCINNICLMVSFIKVLTTNNNSIQLFFSTHNTNFVNKLDLKNVIVMHNGNAYSFKTDLTDETRGYLAKNPNLDLFKLFFSKKCVLVEGITEELFIKAYLQSSGELNDIEVISFHKGYKEIMDIWIKVNQNSTNRLGIVRDYDNQQNAKIEHEKYNDISNICVKTTKEYTLEPEIVKTENNYEILKQKYGDKYGWKNMTKEELEKDWRETKSFVMYQICQDMINGKLTGFTMPMHIKEILDFLEKE